MSRIYATTEVLKVSKLGKENPLPQFLFQREEAALDIMLSRVSSSETLTEDELRRMGSDQATPLLPYRLQDNYDRRQENSEIDVVVLENEKIKAVFFPQYGGRLASLYYKEQERELLFKNPVFQPANLAIRNAWFSGGVEWNGPLFGHSLLTCSPVYFGLVETEKGPLLRIYEFDRALETTWQVDIFLPEDSDKLCTHVKLRNPGRSAIRYYWWTNIAVPCTEHTRVLSPTGDTCIQHTPLNEIKETPYPYFKDFDGSYPKNYPGAGSIFFKKSEGTRPFIANVEKNGKGLMHSSTETLYGRKFWTWGTHAGAKRWMNFLSREGEGDYIELQAGITTTQMETLPMPGESSLEWTECIMPWEMKKEEAFKDDIIEATQCALDQLEIQFPKQELENIDSFLKQQTERSVKENLSQGLAWGALYEKQRGEKISTGLSFDAPIGEKEQIWYEILEYGNFVSRESLPETLCWQCSPSWIKSIEDSAKKHGLSYLHALLLGTAALERKEFEKAGNLFKQSLKQKENYFALRNQALIEDCKKNPEKAADYYQKAWECSDEEECLGIEIIEFLNKRKLKERLSKFLKVIPTSLQKNERIRLVQTNLAFQDEEFEKVLELLKHPFTTIREGETILTDIWFNTQIRIEEKKLNRKLSEKEEASVRKNKQAPSNIDFRMR